MSLPHLADEFAADVQLLRLAAAENPAGRRQDRDAQAVEDLGDAGGAPEDPAARRRDALDVRQDPAVLRIVFQEQPHHLALGQLLVRDDLDVREVPLGLEDLRHALLQLRMGDARLQVAALVRVLDDRDHVADGVAASHSFSSSAEAPRSGAKADLPRRLPHSGDFAPVGQVPEAQPAHAELPVVAAAPAADLAPVVAPGAELRGLRLLHLPTDAGHALASRFELRASGARPRARGFGLLRSLLLLLLDAERDAEPLEEFERVGPLPRLHADRDVHALDELDLVEVDLREDDLLGDPEVVVPRLVERPGRQAAEVADAGDHDRDQAVEELVCPRAAERHLDADLLALAELEVRDRLARAGERGLLARDLAEVARRGVEPVLVLDRLAHAHRDRDLLDAREGERVVPAERLLELGDDFVPV